MKRIVLTTLDTHVFYYIRLNSHLIQALT